MLIHQIHHVGAFIASYAFAHPTMGSAKQDDEMPKANGISWSSYINHGKKPKAQLGDHISPAQTICSWITST